VTVKFAIFAVPLTLVVSFSSALLLNSSIKGISFYRGLFYLPVLCSGVAIAVI